MAFGNVGLIGDTQNKTSANSVNFTVTNTANVGNVVVVAVAIDNISTGGGNTNDVTSVTDSTGANTYTKIREWSNAAAAAGAATVALFYSVIGTQLTGGSGSITVNFSNNTTAKAVTVWEFTTGAGSLSIAGTQDNDADGADAAAITLSGLAASTQYLWVHAIATEGPLPDSYTKDADYTDFTRAGTNTAGATSNMVIAASFRIFTGTSDTVDVTTTARDYAQILIALKEAGTTFNNSVSGALTFSGVLVRQTNKGEAGALTFVGALTKQTQRSFAGALTFVGTLVKETQRAYAAALTFVGDLATSKVFANAVSGALTFVGTLVLQTQKALAGALTFTGALVRETGKVLSGALTFIGTLARETQRAYAGALTFTGTLTSIKVAINNMTGASTFVGTLVRETQKALAGSLTFAGTLVRETLKALAGAVTFSGTLVREVGKTLAGAVTFTGTRTTLIQKTLTGTFTPNATLATLYQPGAPPGGGVVRTGTLLGVGP